MSKETREMIEGLREEVLEEGNTRVSLDTYAQR